MDKFLEKLSTDQQSKVTRSFLLFRDYGLKLPAKYLKRMSGTKELWELRAKRVRIFLIISGNTGIAVHGMIKKTQKTPRQEIELAEKRAKKAREDLL